MYAAALAPSRDLLPDPVSTPVLADPCSEWDLGSDPSTFDLVCDRVSPSAWEKPRESDSGAADKGRSMDSHAGYSRLGCPPPRLPQEGGTRGPATAPGLRPDRPAADHPGAVRVGGPGRGIEERSGSLPGLRGDRRASLRGRHRRAEGEGPLPHRSADLPGQLRERQGQAGRERGGVRQRRAHLEPAQAAAGRAGRGPAGCRQRPGRLRPGTGGGARCPGRGGRGEEELR